MDIREKIAAMAEEWKKQQDELHQQRLRKIAHKKHHQKRNDWPSSKSPV